ncbi:MAG TPA: carbon-nitrogen hydrolase family protein [Mariprofundaceae bacterium]|nr:carbon-nitrogen hydrolase family protein [Mariprofundaceae bacterium]
MRVSCIQMNSGQDKEANLKQAAHWLEIAADAGSDLAVLPENFAMIGADDAGKRAAAEPEDKSMVLDFLSAQAANHRMAVIGGSVALCSGNNEKFRNACAVFDQNGNRLGIYDKMHLFDVDIGNQEYRESELVEAGGEPVLVGLDEWKIGLSICYDVRFPELYRRYSSHGCQILSVVAAFTVPTGMAHWQTLLSARAIENQCYVVASAQWGKHPGGRQTWGHSMVINPWGDILGMHEEGEGVVTADLSMQELVSIRTSLPALKHRVLES